MIKQAVLIKTTTDVSAHDRLFSHVNKLDCVSDDHFLLLMCILYYKYIILYVPVVLGKVYDSKRPGKELTPLKIKSLQPIYWINTYRHSKILKGFGIMMKKNSTGHELFREWLHFTSYI